MFEYFNEKAIKSVVLSQEEARRTGYNLVGSEHLLLGVIGEGTSTASQILANKGINLKQTRDIIEQIVGRGGGFSPSNIPFTPRVKRIFESAFEESRQLGVNYISPEHILLAIAKEKNTVAARILTERDIDLDRLRVEILKNLGEKEAVAASGDKKRFNPFGLGEERSAKPRLEEFSTNLTALAREGKLDPVVGRSTEIQRTIQILGRRTKNNPVLVGEPGVGKTAIAEGLAQRIVDGDVPDLIQEKEVVSLDMSSLLAGTKFRGEFEERLKSIVEEVKKAGNIILVIDEIHTMMGAGAMGGAMDAANLLKPALARGELQCLGSTTLDEYRQYIEKDAALERRFQKVKVGEPSVEDSIQILQGLRKTYEEFHQVKFTDKAIESAVTLSERYITDRFLPDKAIDLIDEAGSRVHLRHSMVKDVVEPENTPIDPQALTPVVDDSEIAEIVAAWTGVPVAKTDETEAEVLLDLEANLHERVIGQDEAVKAVSRALRRSRSGLGDRKRPIASMIFSGPTGVGKTELAKALATLMFGKEDAMIRIDMSEFMESHTVSKLIGSPPGFVGYDEGGQLTEAVRRKPYSVILFDEIEKAHPDVFNLFLQLLDDGRLTDAQGRVVNFKNTVIIMTSNIGAKAIEKGGTGLGFGLADDTGEGAYQKIKERVNDELKNYFRPEFLNRLDEVIVFRQLTKTEVASISHILLKEVSNTLKEQRDITLEVTNAFTEKVIAEGFDPSYGARPLRRAIMRLLEDSLAEAILSGKIQDGDRALVDLDEEKQTIVSAFEQPSLVKAAK